MCHLVCEMAQIVDIMKIMGIAKKAKLVTTLYFLGRIQHPKCALLEKIVAKFVKTREIL